MTKRLLFLSLMLLVPGAIIPLGLMGQDDWCGTECVDCFYGVMGKNAISIGIWAPYCMPFDEVCPSCYPQLVKDGSTEVERVANMIRALPAAGMGELVEEFGDRLLVSPDRNLLVIQGNGCDPEVLSSVLFVSQERARALETLGVRNLSLYLKEVAGSKN